MSENGLLTGESYIKNTSERWRIRKVFHMVALPPSQGSSMRKCPSTQKTFDIIGNNNKTSLFKGIKRTYEWYIVNIFEESEKSAK